MRLAGADEQLALNTVQSEKVSEINKQFREKTEPIVAEIKNIRTALLGELTSQNPDTARLNQYTEKIGELQKQLQKEAIVQFQQLKQICTGDQCLKLSAIFSEVYCCQRTNPDKVKGTQQHDSKKKCCTETAIFIEIQNLIMVWLAVVNLAAGIVLVFFKQIK